MRDLEGVSIDRERFQSIAPGLDLDPSVFFPVGEARQRLVYYLISNQLNHVVAAVSRLADMPEADLWLAVAEALSTSTEDGETASLIAWLLAAETLPAKANFTSCFAGCGERPDDREEHRRCVPYGLFGSRHRRTHWRSALPDSRG